MNSSEICSISDYRDKKGGLSKSHGIVQKVVKLELTVKKTEKLINDTIESLKAEEEPEKKQNIKCSMSMKLYVNTLKQAYDAIINTGVDAKYNEIDKGDYLEVVVKIPKR